jgi:hypothetical protein
VRANSLPTNALFSFFYGDVKTDLYGKTFGRKMLDGAIPPEIQLLYEGVASRASSAWLRLAGPA